MVASSEHSSQLCYAASPTPASPPLGWVLGLLPPALVGGGLTGVAGSGWEHVAPAAHGHGQWMGEALAET